MLGKLFKHEMKAMTRLLLPLFLVLAALTVIDRVVIYLDIFKGTLAVIPGFITLAYVMSIIAVVVVSSVLIILRFYKNLVSDEGYLMFTLPVKSNQLINSKLLASFLWTVLSFVAVFASILAVASGSFDWSDFTQGFKMVMAEIKTEFGNNLVLFFVEVIFMVILGIINSILLIYVSVAVGQLFNGHKVLGSFAAYIGINIALQIVMTICTAALGFLFRDSFEDITSITHILFPLVLFFLLVINAAYYLATDFIFKRRLNLE